ncbi:AT-hook motif nuclear-localized protein 1-like [Olea europaea var. sylvestris]|uniref:AT-hook motif nuclear-localized protein 1-like n=1 Tax=Olea europaea var. sylvestris TaxID=158386 RepID=UPI000C1D13BD|nr:AT-hook motif nuclear-localized protein 1-like [Olea europaea var. sylvestris]
MEEKEGSNVTGVTVKRDEAPQGFRIEPRVENHRLDAGSAAGPTPETQAIVPVPAPALATEVKKKRGRPRKYAPDGSALALSPMPISASIPLTGDFLAWKHRTGRPVDSYKKKHKSDFERPAEKAEYSGGASFMPHVITVNAGEDVTMKIISFPQQGSRCICVLAANGPISNVTLQQPNFSGCTLTYEGRFEILSLMGSFMPSDNRLTKSRSGGMSVSLAGPDGRVLGGGLGGMLLAAGPVQVVIASFLPSHHQESKPKKQKYERTISFTPSPANPFSEERCEGASGGQKPNLNSSASFRGDNLTSANSIQGSKIAALESNVSLSAEDSREQRHEITS